MTRRIISAAVAAFLAILVLIVDFLPLFIVIISALSVVAVYEMLVATKYIKNKALSVLSLCFVFLVPVMFIVEHLRDNLPMICCIFLLTLFIVMIYMHEKVSFEAVSLVGFVSISIPLSLSCLLFIRLLSEEAHGMFLMVFTLTIIWVGDAGAYFVGTLLGKHKMAPKISPKKTWEGFVGGLICSGLIGFAAPFVYEIIYSEIAGGKIIETNKLFFAATAVICSALGVVGDFSASLVKRQCAVKDFGNIMPGHGGVLDRFDSVLFAAPFMYQALLIYFPIGEFMMFSF
ncbi:MAG: phosphatidate cytidylyltransferase [Oscillospiraceae bacterium]|nr:phosphatidate cytidylyltransferase [Oscillospiraceae bacterium]